MVVGPSCRSTLTLKFSTYGSFRSWLTANAPYGGCGEVPKIGTLLTTVSRRCVIENTG